MALSLKPPEGEPLVVELVVEGDVATGYMELAPGTWDLAADPCAPDNTLVATGQGRAVVLPGNVTEVNLNVSLVNGAIGITVERDAPRNIADTSYRPAQMEITGIGAFSIAGLSRVGWDIEVIRTPAGDRGRVHTAQGWVDYPDVAMLNPRSSAEQIAALATWAKNGTPMTMTLIQKALAVKAIATTSAMWFR